jgi:hypothetical protein
MLDRLSSHDDREALLQAQVDCMCRFRDAEPRLVCLWCYGSALDRLKQLLGDMVVCFVVELFVVLAELIVGAASYPICI